MKKTINDLKSINEKINAMLDKLGEDNFDDTIPFHLEYNGAKAEILFCPESVETLQDAIEYLIEVFTEDYL